MFRFEIEGLQDVLVSYDPEARAAYVKVRQGRVAKTRKEAPGIMVDIGATGQLLGMEILETKKIELKVMVKISKEFNVPALRHFDPRYLSRVYSREGVHA